MQKTMIICVDDERIVLNSLNLQLRKNFGSRFELEMCENPEDALSILQDALDEGFDVPLVISDYIMPGMKGDRFLKEVRALSPETRTVLLTGQATLDGVVSAINNANLFRYLPKPWEEVDLTMTVNSAVDSFYSQNRIQDLSVKNEQLYLKMRDMFVSSIRALSNAIDARDKYTTGHSKRVTFYSLLLAQKIGFPPERLENLEYMSILHDVGKIGIPDAILLKESGLSFSEYEDMKHHVVIGAEILKNIIGYEEIIEGVLYHHERYDGLGYKCMRMGDDIPVEARIICIADAFDAMTSDRPYRIGMPRGQALLELKAHSGKQFDPALVDIFCELILSLPDYVFATEGITFAKENHD